MVEATLLAPRLPRRAIAALTGGFRSARPPALAAALGGAACVAFVLGGCARRGLSAEALRAGCLLRLAAAERDAHLLLALLRRLSDLDRRRFALLLTGRRAAAAARRPRARRRRRLVVRHWANERDAVEMPPRPLRAHWTLLLPDYALPDGARRLKEMLTGVLRQVPERGGRRVDSSYLRGPFPSALGHDHLALVVAADRSGTRSR